MKLYDSVGPNPRLVRMFLHEKGVEIPDRQDIDIIAGENRQADYTGKNPGGQLPALQLDDGTILAETVAICEYIEEKHPEPVLIGATPESRAHTRMWVRRVEQRIVFPLVDGFRFAEGKAMFEGRLHLIPHAADDCKAMALEGQAWLEGLLDSDFVAGDRPSLADVVLYAFLDFGSGVGQPYDAGLPKLHAWFQRMGARESAEASLHPAAKAAGMRA